jgi:hypothetical protein
MQASTLQQDLVALERQFWTGDANFYRQHLDEKCLTVFQEQAGVFSKEDVALQASDPKRWRVQQIQPKGFLQPTDDTAIVTCEVYAKRATGEPYHTLTSSGYIRRHGEWKMTFHQQTPLESANHVDQEKSVPDHDAAGDRPTRASRKRASSDLQRPQGSSRASKRTSYAYRSNLACGFRPPTPRQAFVAELRP